MNPAIRQCRSALRDLCPCDRAEVDGHRVVDVEPATKAVEQPLARWWEILERAPASARASHDVAVAGGSFSACPHGAERVGGSAGGVRRLLATQRPPGGRRRPASGDGGG